MTQFLDNLGDALLRQPVRRAGHADFLAVPEHGHSDRVQTGLQLLDEVTSVSGQLVSLGEVRQVLLDHPLVAAAEVVERTDATLGRSLAAAVVLIPDVAADQTIASGLLDTVRELLGELARPRALAFVDRFGDELSPGVLHRTLGSRARPRNRCC